MNNQYFIRSNDFQVQDYSYVIKKNHQRLEIDTTLEVLGNFYLPERTLKLSHYFHNQISENNYLQLDESKSCSQERFNNKCYVFTNKSFINLENDKFFSKSITIPTDVEFTTSLDVDVADFLNNSVDKKHDFEFYEFVDNIKSNNIQNVFKYQNHHFVTRNLNDPLNQRIQLFDEVHINKNQQHKYLSKQLSVDFFDYSNNKNQYIKNWFGIDLKGDWTLIPKKQYIDFNFDDERHVYEINKPVNLLQKPNTTKKIVQYLTTFLQNKKNGMWLENMHSKTGLFFTKNTKGYLIIEAQLVHQNKADNINFSNFFTFKREEKNNVTTIYKSTKNIDKTLKYKAVDI